MMTVACIACCAAVCVVRAEDAKPLADRPEIKLTDAAIKLHKSALMIDGSVTGIKQTQQTMFMFQDASIEN